MAQEPVLPCRRTLVLVLVLVLVLQPRFLWWWSPM